MKTNIYKNSSFNYNFTITTLSIVQTDFFVFKFKTSQFLRPKVKESRLILICTMMHQHFVCPRCQSKSATALCCLSESIGCSDMTRPAPLIELQPVSLPWLSCCYISVNLIVGAVHHVLVRRGKEIKGQIMIFYCFRKLILKSWLSSSPTF